MGQDQYIYNLARNMVGQVGVREAIAHFDNPDWTAERFGFIFADNVARRMRQWKPETLGRIASFGRGWNSPEGGSRLTTTMLQVRRSPWLDESASGETLLLRIALGALLAAMYDVVAPECSARRERSAAA